MDQARAGSNKLRTIFRKKGAGSTKVKDKNPEVHNVRTSMRETRLWLSHLDINGFRALLKRDD